MKNLHTNNLICPISDEKYPELIPRGIAAMVVVLSVCYQMLMFYHVNGAVWIALFLVMDFFIRGYFNGKYSLLAMAVKKIYFHLPQDGKLTGKAPKMFSARLGLLVSVIILVANLTNLFMLSQIMTSILIFFAVLESIFNFCVGCYIYTLFVYPFFKPTDK